jgi:hypothetical protein
MHGDDRGTAMRGHCAADQTSIRLTLAGTHRLDQTRLGRGQQLREDLEVATTGGGELERSMHVDADHMSARREPQLALARQQNIPGLVLLPAD